MGDLRLLRKYASFCTLSFITLISLIYCYDYPIIDNMFKCLVKETESPIYGICLSLITAYIFYLFQIVIPYIHWKYTFKPIINRKLDTLLTYMRKIFEIFEVNDYHSKIEKDSIIEKLNTLDIFEDPSFQFINSKEVIKIDALVYNLNKIYDIIHDMYQVGANDKRLNKLLANVDESNLKNIIFELSDDPPGNKQCLPRKTSAKGRFSMYNKRFYNDEIADGLIEYQEMYSKIEKYK